MTTADGTVVGTTKIVNAGDAAQRWNLVILGDGYQASELAQYEADVKKFVDTLFATPPFDRLRPAVNVFRVDVTSTDSGADEPTRCGGSGATPATYFDATFCSQGIQRLLVVNQDTALTVARDQVPQVHMVLVSVNSPVYGGSGGGVAVFSQAPDAVDIALHEMGHTAFGLADEYESLLGCGLETDHDHHPGPEPAEPNVTTVSDRTRIKWRTLIRPSTPVPTTSNPDCTKCDPAVGPPPGLPFTVVGAFEGADHYHCGAYRPQFNCQMRVLGNAFCAVCTRRIRETLHPFLPTILAASGRITFLRAHDVGTRFGPPDDQIDVEVVVKLDSEPDKAFGFRLRADDDEGARQGMLDTLRGAFNRNRPVVLDYRRAAGLDNGLLLRVADRT
ncbi:M64 family metallopeptidase [Spirillospora sp. NPDC047279]|uniref:M64 family metallopeptidase n=1 Tax=Spirillospora sp. NPDC047279 TaxID=3155478 RepID=UPI0033D64423